MFSIYNPNYLKVFHLHSGVDLVLYLVMFVGSSGVGVTIGDRTKDRGK